MLRYLEILLIMVIQWPTLVPFTSKDRVTYQINGKTTMSKEKKMNKKDFWVGRMLLITCSISNKHPCYFQKQSHTLSNILQNWKHFQKDQHLCKHSNERESLQRLPKQWPLYNILSKTTQSTISNKSKWSSK